MNGNGDTAIPRDAGKKKGTGGRAKDGRKSGPKRLLVFLLKLFLYFHILYIGVTSICIFAYRYVNPPVTLLMAYRAVGYGWKIEKPLPLPLKKVPLYIKNMLISVEDGKFYTHFGIDFEAFKRAREINAKVGKPLYGGSTLTMQVARTLFLVPEKSYIRKYLEVMAALELEVLLPKDRILELYFGYAEWGKGIFGIEAASRHWFGTGISSISRDQAARLIALLSSPIKYTPETLNKSGILRERYAYLARRFVATQAVSPDQETTVAPPPGDINPSELPVTQGGAENGPAVEGAQPGENAALPETEPRETEPRETEPPEIGPQRGDMEAAPGSGETTAATTAGEGAPQTP